MDLLATEENRKQDSSAQTRLKVLKGHEDTVKSCQFLCNDEKILSASHDKTIVLWDFESGRQLQNYENGHSMFISQARVDVHCNRFVSCGWDKKVVAWDLPTGQVQWRHSHDGIVTCCNFSHDGKLVVSGSDLDHSVKVWDAHTGECISRLEGLHTNTITSCMFSPSDDRIITTSMDQTIRFWDLKTRCNTITMRGHTNVISDASMTRDEHWMATVSYDKSIQVWDISTGAYRSKGSESFEKAHEGCISSCDFDASGTLLVTGGYDNQVCVWDVEHHVQNLRLQGHQDWVEDVAFSQDGKWIVSCSKDKTVRIWNMENAEHLPLARRHKESMGNKVYTCSQCGKPFSLSQGDHAHHVKQCVFCRLQTPDRNVPHLGL